jgi:hypothetical protein
MNKLEKEFKELFELKTPRNEVTEFIMVRLLDQFCEKYKIHYVNFDSYGAYIYYVEKNNEVYEFKIEDETDEDGEIYQMLTYLRKADKKYLEKRIKEEKENISNAEYLLKLIKYRKQYE